MNLASLWDLAYQIAYDSALNTIHWLLFILI